MPLLLELGEEIDFSCACVAETIFLISLLLTLNLLLWWYLTLMFQNREVIVTSFGCYWYSWDSPQSPDCWSSCNVWGKTGAGGIEGDSGIVTEVASGGDMQNLGGRLVFMLMRGGILVGEVAVKAL